MKTSNFLILILVFWFLFSIYQFNKRNPEIIIPIVEPEVIKQEVIIPIEKSEIIKQKVEITAYNAERGQTDSTPLITASNKKIKLGYIALSRDLEKKHDLKFGDIVYIPELSNYKNYPIFFVFEDRMNKRYKNSVDIFLWDREQAIRFGRRSFEIYIIKIRE